MNDLSYAGVFTWLVHATLIIVVAYAVDRVFQKRFSEICQQAWIGCFSALAILMVWTWTGFPLTVALPIAPQNISRSANREAAPGRIPVEINSMPVIDNGTQQPARFAPLTAESPSLGTERRAANAVVEPQRAHHRWWALLVIAMYFVGLLCCLTRIAAGWMRLHGMTNAAIPFTDAQNAVADCCAALLRLRQRPDCRVSAQIPVAMTYGILRPIVLVPDHFDLMTKDQQRHCLLHEMAHVLNRDSCWNWIAEISSAFYWFHPLVHLARVRYRRSREDTADDSVLRCGESVVAYSKSLLEIVGRMPDKWPIPIIVSSAATHLESRVRRILHPRLRTDASPRWIKLIAGLMFLVIASTSINRTHAVAQATSLDKPAGAADSDRPDVSGVGVQQTVQPIPDDSANVPLYNRFQSAQIDEPVPLVIRPKIDAVFEGRVTDLTGPVSGAIVIIRQSSTIRDSAGRYVEPSIVGKTTTDSMGRYRVTGVPLAERESLSPLRWEVLVSDSQGRLAMNVYPLTAARIRQGAPYQVDLDIHLAIEETIIGTIVSPDGNALADVQLLIQQLTVAQSIHTHADPFARTPRDSPFSNPHTYRFPSERLRQVVRTDNGGRFSIPIPKSGSVLLNVHCDGYLPQFVQVDSSRDSRHLVVSPNRVQFTSPATIELRKLLAISALVVDQNRTAIPSFRLAIVPSDRPWTSFALMRSENNEFHTTAEFLRESVDTLGNIQLRIDFPYESGMLPLSTKRAAEEIIAKHDLRLIADQGARASGRVVVDGETTGIADAVVHWHSSERQIDTTEFHCSTAEDGRWQMVIPKRAGYLSVVGQVDGLDLWTMDRFNTEPSGHETFTIAVPDHASIDVTFPDFNIKRIATRLITLVDINDQPVAGEWVTSECIDTLYRDQKIYRLEQQLAQTAQTDANGQCQITLNRSSWQHGSVRATKFHHDDDSNATSYAVAESAISVEDPSPIRLVLRDPWTVTGQVTIDGAPATDLQVGLVRKLHEGDTEFYWQGSELVDVDDRGAFTIRCVPRSGYAIRLIQRSVSGLQYCDVNLPLTTVTAGQFSTGVVAISRKQFSTIPQTGAAETTPAK